MGKWTILLLAVAVCVANVQSQEEIGDDDIDALLAQVNQWLQQQREGKLNYEQIVEKIQEYVNGQSIPQELLKEIEKRLLNSCCTDGENEKMMCVLARCLETLEIVEIGGTITINDNQNEIRKKRDIGGTIDIEESLKDELRTEILRVLTETYNIDPLPTVIVSVTAGENGTFKFVVSANDFNQDLLVLAFKEAAANKNYDQTFDGLVTKTSQVMLSCPGAVVDCNGLISQLKNTLDNELKTYEEVTCEFDDFFTVSISEMVNDNYVDFFMNAHTALSCTATVANCETITCTNNEYCMENDGLFSCDCAPNSSNTPCQCDSGFAVLNKTGCDPITCPVIDSINNGHISCSDDGSFDSVCTIMCDGGYELSPNMTIKCGSAQTDTTTGVWSAETPTCKVLQCDALPNPTNGVSDCKDGKVNQGESCSFGCDEGYLLNASATVNCVTVTSGAAWDGNAPACNEIVCSAITDDEVTNGDSGCSSGVTSFGNTCTITCDSGFSLNEAPMPKCVGEGSWDNIPPCQQIMCPVITFTHGTGCSESNYGATCNLDNCDSGYELTGGVSEVTCGGDGMTKSGVWNNFNPQSCTEINYCENEPCNANQICTSIHIDATYQCTCGEGFIEPQNHDGQNFQCIDVTEGGAVIGTIDEAVPDDRRKKRATLCDGDELKIAIELAATNNGQTLTDLTVTCDGDQFSVSANGANDDTLLFLVYEAMASLGKSATIKTPIITDASFLIVNDGCTDCATIVTFLTTYLTNNLRPSKSVTCDDASANFEISVEGTSVESLTSLDVFNQLNSDLAGTCTLQDFDECLSANDCVGLCTNTEGAYTCEDCEEGKFDKFAGTAIKGRTCAEKVLLQCGSSSITVSADIDYLKSTGFGDDLSAFHLFNPSCAGTTDGNRLRFELTNFESCGTEVVENADKTISYRNYITTFGIGELTVGSYFRYGFECVYGYSTSVELNGGDGFIANKTQFVVGPPDPHTQNTEYEVTLSLKDENFTKTLESNNLHIGTVIGIEGEVDTAADVSLRLDECWAQSTNDSSAAKIYFLQAGCPVQTSSDISLNLIKNGVGKIAQMTVQVFGMIEEDSVFIFCDVDICAETCNKTHDDCSSARRRRSTTDDDDVIKRRNNPNSNTIQLGPLEKEVEDLKETVRETSNVTIGVVVTLCLLVLIVVIAAVVWKFKGPKKNFERANFDSL